MARLALRRTRWNSTTRLVFCTAAAALAVGGIAARVAFARGSAPPLGAGVVVIETNLGYQGGAAAGTGMVLSRSGEVLTNNHVIRGATTIRVVVPKSGRSYPARVIGYDVADDIAVLQLQGASGLRTISLGNSGQLHIGQSVIAVGNAGGTGSLAAAAGKITGLGRTITASDEQGSAEQLNGLIETNAGLEPGDSGGPLLDSAHKVVGIDTAASSRFVLTAAANDAYAIPINRALSIAKQIEAGKASASVHLGATAFLGVQVQALGFRDTVSRGGLVTGVVTGSPADEAGLVPRDVITAVDGRAVTSPPSLSTIMLSSAPGATVQLTWLDQLGNEQTATVTLASGPPQ